MRKKIFLSAILLFFALTSCGNDKANTSGTESIPTESTTPVPTESTTTPTGSTTVTTTPTETTTIPTEDEPVDLENHIFISEYLSGYYDKDYNPTGNNNDRAIELFNPTTEAVNLSGYSIQIYSSLSTTPSQVVELVGTISPSSCFVITNVYSQADLLAKADMTGNLFFSGKHTVGLFLNDQLVDIIGSIGFEYVTDIGLTVNGSVNALKENRLTRLPNSEANTTFTESEWRVEGNCDFDNLGVYQNEASSLEQVIKYLQDLYDNKTFTENVNFLTSYNKYTFEFVSYDETIISNAGVVTLNQEKTTAYLQVTIFGDTNPYYLQLTIYVM